MSAKHYFVSDLHLFAKRSHGEQHESAIFETAAGAESFVLGGDIFDFTWTTRATVDQTVDDAAAWLRRLVQHAPRCQFHFVVGNHDYNRAFMQQLEEQARISSNFSWHEYYLRQADRIFLHGDVADRHMGAEGLAMERARWLAKGKKPQFLHHAYEWAMHSRLHKLAGAVAYPKQRVARRIMHYLGQVGHGPESGTRHVYFGHTHKSLSNFEYGGLMFHNGGAPLVGLNFRIVEVAV